MHGKNIIGETYSAAGKRTFQTINPATNEKLPGDFHEATLAELKDASRKAGDALAAFGWMKPKKRAKFLRQIVKEIKEDKKAIFERFCLESGLPESRAKAEMKRTLDQLENFAGLIEDGSYLDFRHNPPTKDLPELYKTFQPIGVVGVFGASNFPFAYSTVGGDTAAALAAGCPVIVKSHPMHAGTGELVAECVLKAAKKTGMPDGTFSNLNASTQKIGGALVQDPEVKAIGFTGSFNGGVALKKLADERPDPIPVFAEMGSENPVILLPGLIRTQKDKWLDILTKSITDGTGQFCTNPGLLFLMDSKESRAFLKELGERITSLPSTVMLGPGIHKQYSEKRQKAVRSKHEALYTVDRSEEPNRAQQSLLVVRDEVFQKNEQLHQEVFGPHSTAVLFKNKNSLRDTLRGFHGQLTATINGTPEDLKANRDLVYFLQRIAGRVIFNGVPTGVRVDTGMHHGGPFPASTDSRFTAVGNDSIYRFLRPVCFQNPPEYLDILPNYKK